MSSTPRIIDYETIDAFRDVAEQSDNFGALASYIADAAAEGVSLRHANAAYIVESVVEALRESGEDEALWHLDNLAAMQDYRTGNCQLAAYEVWRSRDCGNGPFAHRVDGVEVSDSHLLTLGRRIAAIENDAVLTDIDYAAWRTGWGAMQPIADAIAAMHAMGDVCGVEDCLDILTSAVRAGAVEPPRLRRKQYGTLGFAGGLGGFTKGGAL